MKIYVDNMLVKNSQTLDHIRDLEEAFGTLRRHQMKLNPTKYPFRVTSRIFLKFFISKWRIETNLEKIKAIIDMKHSSSKKEIQ